MAPSSNRRLSAHHFSIPISLVISLFVLSLLATLPAQAQTYSVLHYFTNSEDGATPWAGLTMDAAGNLYGTAAFGGAGSCMGGCGTVFKLSHRASGWTLSPLYNFNGVPDGAHPEGKLIFGPDGRLYGTTAQGGQHGDRCQADGCGVIFAMRPPANICQTVICFWSEQPLYTFTGGDDGARPTGAIAFDRTGDVFGSAWEAGQDGAGTVYELSPSGGGWSFGVVYYFSVTDGANPYGGVMFDSAGALYGTTQSGGSQGKGVVYQFLQPQMGGTENILHNFNGIDGNEPLGGLFQDAGGNIYGTTFRGGPTTGGGEAFGLTQSGGNWEFNVIYGFTGRSGPWGNLVMDTAGNLYGTTFQEGAQNFGSVFKLTHSGGGWIYSTLYDFNGQDGANPRGNIVLDANGNLYGTAAAGGQHSWGVVWEITP